MSNSGLIRGNAGAGVALAGGGSVTNGGTISGFSGNAGNGATGIGVSISEFPGAIAADATGVGTITNNDGGVIEGQVFGAVLQGGGTVTNMGTIRSLGNPNPATPGISPLRTCSRCNDGTDWPGRDSSQHRHDFGFSRRSCGAARSKARRSINDGTISAAAIAIIGQSTGVLTINNHDDGEIIANSGPRSVRTKAR